MSKSYTVKVLIVDDETKKEVINQTLTCNDFDWLVWFGEHTTHDTVRQLLMRRSDYTDTPGDL